MYSIFASNTPHSIMHSSKKITSSYNGSIKENCMSIIPSILCRSFTGQAFGSCASKELHKRLIRKLCSPGGVETVFSADDRPDPGLAGVDGDSWIPTCVKFAQGRHTGNLLAMFSEGGKCCILDTTEKQTKVCTRWDAHRNCIFDAQWLDQDTKIITAAGDMTAIVWDVETRIPLAALFGHKGTLKSVSCSPINSALVATGGRDGTVCLWDTRTREVGSEVKVAPVHMIHNAHQMPQAERSRKRPRVYGKPSHSVTSVLLTPDGNGILSAGIEGKVKLWDWRKFESRRKRRNPAPPKRPRKFDPVYVLEDSDENTLRPHAITSLSLSSDGTKLLTSSTASRINLYGWTAPGMPLLSTYQGHQNHSLYPKATLSTDDNFIASGSCDDAVYLWEVSSRSGRPLVKLEGHLNEATCVDWSNAQCAKLASCSDDLTVRVWTPAEPLSERVQNCHRCPNASQLASVYDFGHAHSSAMQSVTGPASSQAPALEPTSRINYFSSNISSEPQQRTMLSFLSQN